MSRESNCFLFNCNDLYIFLCPEGREKSFLLLKIMKKNDTDDDETTVVV